MSTPRQDERRPLIALVRRADRAFQNHMVSNAHARGRPDIKPAHNALFSIMGMNGERTSNLAARAGITRQSMGEVVRDLVDLGILEMVPDPEDRRAKIVRYTEEGARFSSEGFQQIESLERRFVEEFGADEYETARAVLERVVSLLHELDLELDEEGDQEPGAQG
jgi:DNA-binding MarR family transcriptional regulator